MFTVIFRARQKGKFQTYSLDPSTKSSFRRSLQSALVALLVMVAAGCVPSARDNMKKANLTDSVIPKDEAAGLRSDAVPTKGGEPSGGEQNIGHHLQEQSKAGLPASKEMQWPALREAASTGHQAASKLNAKANPEEIRKVHDIALELIRKTENVKAIKICHAIKADEWWFTLYRDGGSFYDLEQHVWSVLKESPEPFLVPKRIPSSQLKAHLAASEPGRTCQAVEPSEAGASADQGGSEKAPSQTKPAAPKQLDQADDAVADRSDQRLSKIASQKQDETPPAGKKIAAKPPSPEHVTIHKPESSLAAAARPETRKEQEREDPKPTPPPKKTALETSPVQTRTKEAKATPRARSAIETDDSKPTCHVFVYGSSMNHSELTNWLDDNGYDASLIVHATPAKLEGYDFVWNYFSPSRGGGTVNLERKADSYVLGLLVEIEDSLLRAFDAKEGHPKYYVRRDNRVPVKRLNDDKTLFAWLYIANPNQGTKRDIWPTAEYKQKILQAASFWGLPESYTARIKSWRSR